MKDLLIYDCEIIRAIRKEGEEQIPGIEYVSKTGQDAWRCFDEMGISVIGAYDYATRKTHVFCEDNMGEFQELAFERLPVGFNSNSFDDKLCAANGVEIHSWDLLVAIWRGLGLEPTFKYPTHAGYGLDAMAKAGGVPGKTGHGALAPVLWQQGKIGEVIDYCLQDVWITKQLVDNVLIEGVLKSPKTGDFIIIERLTFPEVEEGAYG